MKTKQNNKMNHTIRDVQEIRDSFKGSRVDDNSFFYGLVTGAVLVLVIPSAFKVLRFVLGGLFVVFGG